MKKRYSVDGKVYEIPDSEAGSFLSDNPKAVEVKNYNVGGKQYEIPLGQTDSFEKDFNIQKPQPPVDPNTAGLKTPERHEALLQKQRYSPLSDAEQGELDGFPKTSDAFNPTNFTPDKINNYPANTPAPKPFQYEMNPVQRQRLVIANNEANNEQKGTFDVKPFDKNIPTPDNNFNLPTHNALAQTNRADNTTVVAPKANEQAVDENVNSAQREKTKQANLQQAITNTTAKYLKLKGINAPEGSAIFNEQKSKVALNIAAGDASYALDKDGQPGLKQTTGFVDNIVSGWKDATTGAQEDQDFINNWTDQQRIDYLNKKEAPSEYIGTRPSVMGQVAHMASSSVPYMAKIATGAAIGAGAIALAPESAGASLEGLPLALGFLNTAGEMGNSGAKVAIEGAFRTLKHNDPYMSDMEALQEAKKSALGGMIAGVISDAAFVGEGAGHALAPEAAGVLTGIYKNVVKPAVKMAGVSAAATAGSQELDNATGGVQRSQEDILKNTAEVFKDNLTAGGALMSLIHGGNSLPKIYNSALHFAISKEDPANMQRVLQMNEKYGTIPIGTTDKIMADQDVFNKALEKTVPGLDPTSQASIAGLMVARDKVIKESESLDETAKKAIQPKIDAYNAQIAEIQRTGKPFEHEINEKTGTTYSKPTFDDVAEQRVNDLADKIAKGKTIAEPEDLQTQANFPDELEKALNRIAREEKSSQKEKENPKTDAQDNITDFKKGEAEQITQPIELSPSITPIEPAKVEPKLTEPIDADARLKELRANKPDLKLNLVPADAIVKSSEPVLNKETHDNIKERYKTLKQLIECL